MIPCSSAPLKSEPWQRELAEAISDPLELLQLLGLDQSPLDAVQTAPAAFPLRVPRYFAGLMRHGDPQDPLLTQVLPLRAEETEHLAFRRDPVDDMAASLDHGILKKYQGRALLVTTGACAVHCRYCFRRHFPYAEQTLLRHWQAALLTLGGLPDASELILSGGDPLTLSDTRLRRLFEDAARLPQLRRLRIHTRLPVVMPSRVTPGLVRLLAEVPLQAIVVIHANHPNEVTDELGAALRPLSAAGVTLLNQSVLLKSVNDDADTLAVLSDSLFGIGVLPYYLHLLDPVAGAAHFDVPLAQARELMEGLQARVPGYLVPRMVREQPGQAYKTPIAQL